MKVDGKAFKKAREQIRKEHVDDEVPYGEPAIGTQLWLAEKAGVTRRTIQNLEKGSASLSVIDTVGCVLGIMGRELIKGYGQDAITCGAPQVVDFRPLLDMQVHPKTYDKQLFLVTIDPLIINFHYMEYLEKASLKEISLTLYIGKKTVDFTWVYFASIIPSTPWPGIKEMIFEIDMEAPKSKNKSPNKYSQSIMFKQLDDSSSCLEWREFIEEVISTKDSRIRLDINLKFEFFNKKQKILVSIEEIRTYIEKSKEKYIELYEKHNLKYPRFFQPRALMWE